MVTENLLHDGTITKEDNVTKPYGSLKIRTKSGVDLLYTGCVYVHTQGSVKQSCTGRFNLLEVICKFQLKGRVLFLGILVLGLAKVTMQMIQLACLDKLLAECLTVPH